MTDGAMLGGFIQWARANFSADTETFSYLGHGMFAPPAPNLSPIVSNPQQISNTIPVNSQFPLPLPTSYIGANPGYTDFNTALGGGRPKFLAPHTLRIALNSGTSNGTSPLDLVDLVHCFSGSIEELYEVANATGSPFATRFVASANYRFFDTKMIEDSLLAQRAGSSADVLGTAIINAYEDVLASADLSLDNDPDVDFPRTIVVVDPTKLQAVKNTADLLGTEIIAGLTNNTTSTLNGLALAQQNAGVYYDTTCSGDFECNRDDAVADVGALAQALETQFGIGDPIGSAAEMLKFAVQEAVVDEIMVNGTPWFKRTSPTWMMQNGNNSAVGLGIYADWHGIEKSPNNYELSWHAIFYTPVMTDVLLFLQQGTATNTWAEAFQTYWEKRIALGDSVTTAACLPELPFLPYKADITAAEIVLPFFGTVQRTGAQAVLGGNITTDSAVSSVEVQFRVLNAVNNTPVFTSTVTTGRLVTGTHYFEAPATWTVNLPSFKVELSADSNFPTIDPDYSNNVITSTIYNASSGTPFTFTATTANQWISTPSFPLALTSSLYTVQTVRVNSYHFQPSPDPLTQLPVRIGSTTNIGGLSTAGSLTYAWPTGVTPGYHELHVWGVRSTGLSETFSRIGVNYAPANASLPADQKHHFRVDTNSGDAMAFNLAVTGNVTMRIWQPGMLSMALVVPPSAVSTGGGTLTLSSLQSGEYLIEMVGGSGGGSYTLTVNRNGAPARSAEIIPVEQSLVRPEFGMVAPEEPVSVPTAVQLAGQQTMPLRQLPIIAFTLLLCVALFYVVARQAKRSHD